ncbi:MAG: hypothetical protein APF76_02565 [Desulfitibacter sp. BRH_c19]|nr:MAG: hypothetical protein APF76_02565 [Desulfitibacter sp. BRH_c19]
MKIKDRIILGVVSSLIAGIPIRLINDWQYHKGLTDVKYGQMAASLFLPKNKVNTPEAKFVAAATNHVNTGITGIIITYVLSATGRDKAMLKGMGVASTTWVIVYGLISRLAIPVKSKKPLSPVLSFMDHAFFGTFCGLLIPVFGHSSLFPDRKNVQKKDKLPLISTNTNCEK